MNNEYGNVFKEIGMSYPLSIEGGVPSIGFEEFWKEVKKQPSVLGVLEANKKTVLSINDSNIETTQLIDSAEVNAPKRIG